MSMETRVRLTSFVGNGEAASMSRHSMACLSSSATGPARSTTSCRRRPRTRHPPWASRLSPESVAIYRSINAAAETTSGLYKNEAVRADSPILYRPATHLGLRRSPDPDHVHWYGTQRLHGELDNLTPEEYEQA